MDLFSGRGRLLPGIQQMCIRDSPDREGRQRQQDQGEGQGQRQVYLYHARLQGDVIASGGRAGTAAGAGLHIGHCAGQLKGAEAIDGEHSAAEMCIRDRR